MYKFWINLNIILIDKTYKGHNSLLKTDLIFQKSMLKMHSFSIEGTHATLTYKLSYKVMSSLRHSIDVIVHYIVCL